ncbi:MAG: hypothetical protein IJC74_04065 [Clostridia bacterium]|nr:hypothetical protein [Clostridia bacterium]
MKLKIKFLSLLLAGMMFLSLMPIAVSAFSESEITALIGENGVICGNTTLPDSYNGHSLSWSLDKTPFAELSGYELTVKEMSLDKETSLTLRYNEVGGAGQNGIIEIKLAVDKQLLLPKTPEKSACMDWHSFDGTVTETYNQVKQTAETNNPNALEIVNEKLTYTRTSALPFDGMQLILSNAMVADGTVLEYELTRPLNRKTYIFPVVWGSNYFYVGPSGRLSWLEMEGDKIYYLASAAGVNSRKELTNVKVGTTNKFKTVYDFTNKQFDLYIDDVFIKTIPFNKNETRISSFAIVTDSAAVSAGGDVWAIDDVRTYSASGLIDVKKPPTTTVFDFPIETHTSAGTPITWESDNSAIDVESTPGMAKIIPASKELNVNIKASITLNGIKYFQNFAVLLPQDERPPMMGSKYLFYEDFNYGDDAPAVPVPDENTPTEAVLPSSNGVIAGYNCVVPAASASSQSPTSVSVPVITDGKMKLGWVDGPAKGRPNMDKAILWFNSDKSSYELNGEYRLAIEYDIEADNANPVEMLVNTGNGASGLNHRFVSSSIQLGGTNFAAHNGYDYKTGLIKTLPIPQKVRVTIVFDNQGSYDKFDLYVNGAKIIDDFSRRQYTPNIGMLCFTISAENTVYIDNVKVFNVGLSDKEKVDADYISLKNGGFAAINSSSQNLVEADFLYETPEGSSLKFSSDVPGLIDENGTINRPRYSKDATVTATVYTEDYEKSVSYPCTVAGQIVVLPKDENLSGWEPDGYYAIYSSYMLTEETVPAVVVLAAYDKESGKLIKTSATDNLIIPKSAEPYEDNVIYGFVEIPITKADNTRIEAFVLDSYESKSICVDGGLVMQTLDEEKSCWDGKNYTAVFPAFSLAGEENICMVIAAYENGQLTACSTNDVTVYPKGENPDIKKDGYVYGTLNVPEKTENTVVKAMLWRDSNSIKPLVSVK